jgi:hypothetical protein
MKKSYDYLMEYYKLDPKQSIIFRTKQRHKEEINKSFTLGLLMGFILVWGIFILGLAIHINTLEK